MARWPFRRNSAPQQLVEATAPMATSIAARSSIAPTGFDPGVPTGGTTPLNPGGFYPSGRPGTMRSLYESYVSCAPANAAIDVIAKTVTAGGLMLLPDTDATDDGAKADPTAKRPANVEALAEMIAFCNPREDIRQLSRGAVTDVCVFGDAFLEVVWFLGLPYALYSLDSATMSVSMNEHGEVLGYWQTVDLRNPVWFEAEQVIHISFDSLRGGPYGIGIIEKALLPITTWLFTEATLKETMRKGDPPHFAMLFPNEVQDTEILRFRERYQVENLGAANIGNPITATGTAGQHGISIVQMGQSRIAELLDTLATQRDLIMSSSGVPPAKAGIIESGNIGGGTGTSQDKTLRVNTCGPIAELVLEKLNYALTRVFGIEGWSLQFGEVDYRDDKSVEEIADTRLRNGSWTLNRYRASINEPSIGPAGDISVLVDRSNMVVWSDVPALSAKLSSPAAPPPMPTAAPPGSSEPAPPADDGDPKESLEGAWARYVAEQYGEYGESDVSASV